MTKTKVKRFMSCILGRVCCLLLVSLGHCVFLHAGDGSTLQDLLRRASASPSAHTWSAVCRFCYDAGGPADTLSAYADSLRRLALHTGADSLLLEYYIWKSEAAFLQSDTPRGYALKRSAIDLAERLNRPVELAGAASDMAYYLNIDARYDSARYYLRKGMSAAHGNAALGEAYRTMLTNYAASFLYEGQTDSAICYAGKAADVSEMARDTALLIENHNQLGTLYRRKRDLQASLSHFGRALRLCQEADDYRTAAYIYGNLSTVYAEWQQPSEAVDMSRRALDYAMRLGDKHTQGTCLTNLGIVLYQLKGHEQESVDTLQRAVAVLSEVNNRRRLCEAYSFLANIYIQMDKESEATACLDKLEQLVVEMDTDVERYRYLRVKAVIRYSQGRYAEAVACYRCLIDMLHAGYRDTQDYKIYAELADCYRALHRDAESLSALRTAYALRDSAYQDANTRQLSAFAIKYDTAEKELRISRLEETRAREHARSVERLALLGSVIGLLLAGLAMLLYARQRQKVRMAVLARDAAEKERNFLSLQKDLEHRMVASYIEGVESESGRIASELHDDVCNSLLALSMDVRSSSAAASGEFDRQLEMLDRTRERLRTLSHELMPPAFEDATIHEMLDDYVRHLALPSGMTASFSSGKKVDWARLSDNVCFEYYRIAQEAIANAVKHSGGTSVDVYLFWEEGRLGLHVEDDGRGFDPDRRRRGVGLDTIRRRAASIGADVHISSRPGKGTLIEVYTDIPYPDK